MTMFRHFPLISCRATVLTALSVAALTLGACSSVGQPAGASATGSVQGLSQSQVRQQRGEPFALYQTDQAHYWFYDTGKRNMSRERLVFDPQGHVLSQHSAWSRPAFEQVEPQVWHSTDLLHHFGPPLRQERPRPSIFGESRSEPPRTAATLTAAAKAQTGSEQRVWIYGYREYSNYWVVAITVSEPGGLVTAIEITEEPVNAGF